MTRDEAFLARFEAAEIPKEATSPMLRRAHFERREARKS